MVTESISPVVRRLAEIQGGSVIAESREGGGSAFRVFLPDGAMPVPEGATPGTEGADGAPAEQGQEVHIVVGDTPQEEDDDPWEAEAAHQVLAAELRRLAQMGDER